MENKNDIEKSILTEIDSYEIKTTSNSILNAYYNKKDSKVKKTKNKGLFITAGLTASLACVLTIAIVVPIVSNSHNSSISIPTPVVINPQQGVTGGTRSQTAFQLVSGIELISIENTPNYNRLQALGKKGYDDDYPSQGKVSFEDVVNVFDNSYDTLNAFLTGNIETTNVIEQGVFIGQYNHYEYKMTITHGNSNLVFYNNMRFRDNHFKNDEVKTEYTGEILIDGEDNYKVMIVEEYDEEENEYEIEMKIQQDKNFTLTIEQETDNGEKQYEYSFRDKKGNSFTEKFNFEEHKDSNELSVQIIKNGRFYFFESIQISGYSLAFDYRSEFNVRGNMGLNVINNIRTYTDINTGNTIVKGN